MADVSINANCGCGYTTKRLEEAAEHSNRTNHKITILGMVTPVATTNSTVSAIERSRIYELREKIKGGW